MIERSSFIIIVLFCATFFVKCYLAESCVKQTPCLCQINDETKIDLSTLFGEHQYVEDQEGNSTYYFSGCKDAQFINKKINQNMTASLLLVNYTNYSNESNYAILGNASGIHFSIENKHEIAYINDNGTITATIQLICDDLDVPIFKTIDSKINKFALVSPKACLVVEHQGMSGGSKFVLVLFIMLLVYFLGGGLVMYLIRGARGLEMIPNIDFWKNLPGLVKDGIIFLLSGCRPTLVTSAETYDRI